MQLTAHFTLEEFERSATAKAHAIRNVAPPSAIVNIRSLCNNVLEPAREKYGKPIVITSGYRCKELNKLVGGVATSQHMCGMAADLKYDGELFQILAGIKHDQLLVEIGRNAKWIHVSFNPYVGRNRNQTITIHV